MGEVYRARDTRLGRDVAIKVLPDAFTHDADRLARFKREAQVLASLNHPNIAAIYGLEESAGGNALVLELVEGPTLAERIAHGAIPLDEALPVAKQIAEALEAAHEHGIVHRDLKPANIKLTPDGKVKVLDFGLAKAVERSDVGRDFSSAGSAGQEPTYPGLQSAGLSQSPTITSPAMTMGGVILGTAAYMSPEQAKGKAVDRRSDIWAFGCVLYQMLTGQKAFAGDDVPETLAAILRAEARLSALPPDTPESIRRLLRRALAKDRDKRLASMSDARLDLEDTAEPPMAEPPRLGPHRWLPGWGERIILLTLLAASVVATAVYLRPRAPVVAEGRFEIPVPRAAYGMFSAISPDGRYLAYTAPGASGRNQALWLRPVNSLDVRMLQGTESAAAPFWSPDSRSIAFFVVGQQSMKRVEISGDAAPVPVIDFRAYPGTLSDRAIPGGAWNSDGTIITGGIGGIRRFSVSGGDMTTLTEYDKALEETAHGFPSFLPGGRHFLFRALSAKPENQAIYVASLDSKVKKRLLTVEGGVPAIYAAPGFILFLRGSTLMARPFDVERLEFTGDARVIAEGAAGPLSASGNGTVIYRRDEPRSARRLLWIDRTGKTEDIGLRFDAAALRLSPEGNRIAFAEEGAGGRADIHVFSIDRRFRLGLTSDASTDALPVWSPDGSKVIFASDRTGRILTLHEVPAAGTTEARVLVPPESGTTMLPLDWSKDGQAILFTKEDAGRPGPGVQRDIWVLPLTGDRKPFPYLQTRFDEGQATLSPSGRWLAYTSNESGTYHVIVRSFPDASAEKLQISTDGGAWPRWSRDGQQLYYVEAGGRLMAVAVDSQTNFQVGTATSLFDFPHPLPSTANPNVPYDVAADGRFLLSAPESNVESARIAVILNWTTR